MDLSSGLGSPVAHSMQAATFLRAAAAADIHGDRRAHGKDAPCVRGRYRGWISPFVCLSDYQSGQPECSRDCGCSIGKLLLAKYEAGELSRPTQSPAIIYKTNIIPERKLQIKKNHSVNKNNVSFVSKQTIQKAKKKPNPKRKYFEAAPFIRKAFRALRGTPSVRAVLNLAVKYGGPNFRYQHQRYAVEAAGYTVDDIDGIARVVGKKRGKSA